MLGPIQWANVYYPFVDGMFDRQLIEWDMKDPRGAAYSTIKISKLGIQAYENATKDSERI